jgi:CXXX repeat modification system protein
MKKPKSPESAPSIPASAVVQRKRVGQVSVQERDEMRAIFERKNGLTELFKSLADSAQVNSALYDKLVADVGTATTRHSQWWSAMSKKYGWQSAPDGRWEIDFDDCSVYLLR